MDINKPRTISQSVSSFKLPNGYVLPEGRLTPNTLFVGGIDMKVEENEMWDFFTRYGNVKEVKIITYRGGVCKGYGFVYFNEDVNIQSIIEQQIIFKGRKLKLGPAIMKQRIPRSIPTRLVGPTPWISPNHYICCGCCSPVGGGLPQPAPVFSGGSPYNQVDFPCLPFSYSSFGEVMLPQIPMSYTQSPYPYQYTPAPWTPDQRTQPFHQSFVDSGVQTMLNVL
ncbi:deleted in azoospermia-like isoform X1 [Fundulus heteroclitus]|uniref:deleted in azoospermia-like isoform X1 n=1 Tax=Fundulus heteroclitus TaxID=8078 RepID=UPI000B38024D|nr:deleted in azoospermia-like isoform X1 [Fundulus heteroclitus]